MEVWSFVKAKYSNWGFASFQSYPLHIATWRGLLHLHFVFFLPASRTFHHPDKSPNSLLWNKRPFKPWPLPIFHPSCTSSLYQKFANNLSHLCSMVFFLSSSGDPGGVEIHCPMPWTKLSAKLPCKSTEVFLLPSHILPLTSGMNSQPFLTTIISSLKISLLFPPLFSLAGRWDYGFLTLWPYSTSCLHQLQQPTLFIKQSVLLWRQR